MNWQLRSIHLLPTDTCLYGRSDTATEVSIYIILVSKFVPASIKDLSKTSLKKFCKQTTVRYILTQPMSPPISTGCSFFRKWRSRFYSLPNLKSISEPLFIRFNRRQQKYVAEVVPLDKEACTRAQHSPSLLQKIYFTERDVGDMGGNLLHQNGHWEQNTRPSYHLLSSMS